MFVKKILFLFSVAFFLFSLNSVFAHTTCTFPIKVTNTNILLTQIDSINAGLQGCPQDIPSQLQKILKNGVLFVEITDNEDVYASVQNGEIISAAKGTPASYSYKVSASSCVIDVILSKQNPAGAFAAYYLSGQANLGASGFINRLKFFFVKPFLKPALKKVKESIDTSACLNSANNTNRPENCYDTYMQGHEQYMFAKEEWDRKLAETGHICQTQTAAPPKGGNCKYIFEQIKNNDKKWLCWY